MMKKIAGLLAVMLMLSGCMHKVQLNDRSLVQAVGVDLSDDGGYVVTMQVCGASREAANAEQSIGREQYSIVEEVGKTMTDIFAKTSVKQGRELFLGNCKLIILSEEVAKAGVSPVLNYFNANHQINPSVKVVVSQNRAQDVICAKDENRLLSSEGVLDILKSGYSAGFAPRSRLMDIMSAIHAENGTGSLTAIALTDGEQEEEIFPTEDEAETEVLEELSSTVKEEKDTVQRLLLEIMGTALFTGDKLGTIIDAQATHGFSWTQDGMQSTSLEVGDDRLGRVAVITNSQKAHIEPELVGDLIVFDITVDVRSTALEAVLKDGGALSEETKRYAIALQERKIKNEIEYAIEQSQKQGYDLMGLALLTKQRHPKFYKEHMDDWRQTVQGAGYNVSVICRIDSTGVGANAM